MIVYFDTSALVKLVIDEAGSAEAHDAWDGCDLAIASPLTLIETRATLAASRRGGQLTEPRFQEAAQALERRWPVMVPVALSAAVAERGLRVATEHPLKGADAVHLASALALGTDGVAMAVWDRRLHDAAQAEGLGVLPATLD